MYVGVNMKKLALFLVFSLILIFSVKPVEAGISLGKGGITLPAGQTGEICDVWIFATQEGGTYHVETTGDLSSLTVGVTPNDFTLDTIDCPQETNARRACIEQTCRSSDQSSCKIVCVKFAAPMLIEWEPEKTVYSGSILNSIKISAATVKEPFEFSVHVEPMDMKPIVLVVGVVIIVLIVLAVFANKRRKKQ